MAKIYVASSWRNSYQQDVVSFLRSEGHEVYDFTHPNGDMSYGFSWSSIDLIGRIGVLSNIKRHSITRLRKKDLI